MARPWQIPATQGTLGSLLHSPKPSSVGLPNELKGLQNMSQQGRSAPATSPDRYRRGRRIVVSSLLVLSILALLLFGRGILAWWSRQMAARQIDIGAISGAQEWLAWSAWLDPDNGETELMQAICFRHPPHEDRWSEALQSAERKGAPASRIQQERILANIRSGRFREETEYQMDALIESGVSPRDVAAAFVHGYLVRKEPDNAKRVLDAWEADRPEQAHVAYMRGVYWRWLAERTSDLLRRHASLDRAQTEFESVLARQPLHESARVALAELLEDEHRLDEALKQYGELATLAPANNTASVCVARLLRELGHLDEAQIVLEAMASQAAPPVGVAAEMGQIELESGNYKKAERWLQQADLDRTDDSEILRAAATALALQEETTSAKRLFARIDAASIRSAKIEDLLARLATGSHDQQAVDELQRLSRPSTGPADQTREDRRRSAHMSASDLYALDCSACHGANGDGKGRAARYLFPRPRDLRTGRFRLASTINGVPTLEDVETVIKQGMPGTSMRSFENLSDDQRKLLAQEVLRLNRDGIRGQFVNMLISEGEGIDEDEVRQVVAVCTTPGDTVRAPHIGAADSQAIARGKKTYFELGCEKCHGDDGVGAQVIALFDDKGRPSPPRDLVNESFKGGHEPESVYMRIFVGMPGTPHPGCRNLTVHELTDLVHYCRSLSQEPKRSLTNHQRAIQATGRAYLSAMGEGAGR